MPGYIKLYRSIQEHWVYSDSDYLKVWTEMLLCARYIKEPKTDMYDGVVYTAKYGQFIYGRPSWSKRLGVSEQKLRNAIKKLTDDKMIKFIKKFPRFTIYEVCNYEKYNLVDGWLSAGSSLVDSETIHKNNQHNNQHLDTISSGIQDDENQQDNQRATSEQPANNQ